MSALWSIEFLDHYAQRSYPLAEHATRQDATGSITIPNSFFVELLLSVAVGPDTLPDKFFVKTIGILGGGYTIEIGYDAGSGSYPTVATGAIGSAGFTENSRFPLIGLDDFDDSTGKITIGLLRDIEDLPAGIYSFTPQGGALDPDCIRPMIKGVSSISIISGGTVSQKHRGPIELRAGANSRFTVSRTDGEPVQIRWDVVPGEGFTTQCECVETIPPCIRTINNLTGDVDDNFTIIGDGCLPITQITNGIQLKDDCCQPCCGAPELEEVLRVLRGIQDGAATTAALASRIDSVLNAFALVALSSNLSGTCPS